MRERCPFLLVCLFVLGATDVVAAGEKDAVKPVNLEKVNGEGDEDDPFVSADGLTLYYAVKADRTFAIRVSKRTSAKADWPEGKGLLAARGADLRSPFLHKNVLFFASNEPPDEKLAKFKNFDIM